MQNLRSQLFLSDVDENDKVKYSLQTEIPKIYYKNSYNIYSHPKFKDISLILKLIKLFNKNRNFKYNKNILLKTAILLLHKFSEVTHAVLINNNISKMCKINNKSNYLQYQHFNP